MNQHHFVPDFDIDDDYVNANTNSTSSDHPTKPILGEEEEGDGDLMELLWHNGQVVLHNQRPTPKKQQPPSSSSPIKLLHNGGGGGGEAAPPPLDHNLFIQEDEMTSWLHYPLRDDDFCSDLLFPSAPPTSERQTSNQAAAAKPPVPSSVRPPVPSSVMPPLPSPVMPPVTSSVRPPVRNFMNFSRLRGDFTGGNGRGESGPSISKPIVRESTQVNPRGATPASESDLTRRTDGVDSLGAVDFGSSSAVAGGGTSTSEHNRKGKAVVTAASENHPGASSSVASKSEIEAVIEQTETTGKTIADERKRKEREAVDENEEGKGGRGSTSTKRSRAAEVHNLSERKRRDRINERMKALQELIPRCNKSDKASMLDEAIEYMKSLQLQIQMMSMGCGMMPMMYTGMQQYMPHMAMGMGMGMDMGMNRPPPPPPPPPFIPFPNMLASQRPLPPQTRIGGYPPVQASDPSRVYGSNQQFDPNSSQAQYYMDPYQQFRSQPPQFQNQATSYPSSSRVSSSKESEDQLTGNQPTS